MIARTPWLLLLLLALLTSCRPLARDNTVTDVQAQPTAVVSDDSNVAAGLETGSVLAGVGQKLPAEEVLRLFLTQMHGGEFDAAATLYAGDYGWLREINPDLPDAEGADLLARGCRQNGLVCLSVASIEPLSEAGNRFEFAVQFATAEGEILTLGPCCGEEEGTPQETFIFHVVRRDGRYLVEELPPYQP